MMVSEKKGGSSQSFVIDNRPAYSHARGTLRQRRPAAPRASVRCLHRTAANAGSAAPFGLRSHGKGKAWRTLRELRSLRCRKSFERRRTDAGGFDLPVPESALRPCAFAEAGNALPAGRCIKPERHTHGAQRAGTQAQNFGMTQKGYAKSNMDTIWTPLHRQEICLRVTECVL